MMGFLKNLFGGRDEEAHRLVEAGAVLLDVRTAAEFARGAAPGAKNIPVQELGARIREVPAGKTVVVYCQSGMRSASAASTLRAAGFTVHDMGSLSRW